MNGGKDMSKISVFNYVTVDGFFAGPNGETDWFNTIPKNEEWEKFTHGQAQSGRSTLVFGRTTYEMMKSYWPTPSALQSDPGMAKVLNESPKIVFSKTLPSAQEGPRWKNIRVLREIRPDDILKLKEKEAMMLLGSGSIVRQLASLGLIDEYNLAVVPVILGAGKSMFKDVKKTNLKLLEAKSFKNGIVWLSLRAMA